MRKIAKIKDLNRIASNLIRALKKIKRKTATIVALYGELGAGKTTFTQEIGKILKIKKNIISPTFVIMKKYPVTDNFFNYLIHIDAYRLESDEELKKLGWEEIIQDEKNLIVIEWPERVEGCLPDDACSIKLGHIDEETRVFEF